MNTTNGVVRWWNDAKGYGFIATEDNKEVFVHYTAIVDQGFKTLAEGQKVNFVLITGPKGLQASHVNKVVES